MERHVEKGVASVVIYKTNCMDKNRKRNQKWTLGSDKHCLIPLT